MHTGDMGREGRGGLAPDVRNRATHPSSASEDRGRSDRGAPRHPGAAPLCCGSCTRPLSCDWQTCAFLTQAGLLQVCRQPPGACAPLLPP